MDLDEYAQQNAHKYVNDHGDASCVDSDGTPRAFCVEDLADLLKAAYTQGCTDQKRGAVAALATIKRDGNAILIVQQVFDETMRQASQAVRHAEPISDARESTPEDAG